PSHPRRPHSPLFPYTTLFRSSYVLTEDLALYLAKAATYPGTEIINQTIDVSWQDGPKSQQEIADVVSQLTHAPLKIQAIPWLVLDRKSTRLNSSHGSISYAVF